MRVCIGIPAYNAAVYLAQTLDSVRAQTLTDWGLVIVNDGSTDATQTIAEGFCQTDTRMRCVYQKNEGVAEARNTAFRAMPAGEFVIFLDADDVWDTDALQTLVETLDECPDVVAAHGTARYINAHGERFRFGELEHWCREPRGYVGKIPIASREVCPNQTSFAHLAWFNCIPTPGTVLLRRSVAEVVGAWDESLAPSDDWDYFLRCAAWGNFAFIDRPLLSYRRHDGGASSNTKRLAGSMRRLRRKHWASSAFTPAQKRVLAACYKDNQKTMRNQFARTALFEMRQGHLRRGTKALMHGSYRAVLHGLGCPF